MIVWGLVETKLQEAVELFVSRDDAETALEAVLRDEPEWEGLVVLEPIEFGGVSWN